MGLMDDLNKTTQPDLQLGKIEFWDPTKGVTQNPWINVDPELVKQINRIEVKVDTVLSMLGYIKAKIKYFEGM